MFNCIKTSVDNDTVYATMEVSAWINTPVSYTQISKTETQVNYLQPRNYLELNKFYIKLIFEKDEESNYHLARINPRDLMYSVFEDFKLGDFFNKDWSCNNLGELLGFRWIKSYNLQNIPKYKTLKEKDMIIKFVAKMEYGSEFLSIVNTISKIEFVDKFPDDMEKFDREINIYGIIDKDQNLIELSNVYEEILSEDPNFNFLDKDVTTFAEIKDEDYNKLKEMIEKGCPLSVVSQ